ncbi:methionine--tRNA ligase [Candidatus Nomurabacteria bacterium RIFCSPLOWO2_12_FULL_44_11]|uniref:Methionine--tRNA ligase n=1 Tax=Candidatus Nomurabacteria bacterium RIFCSPLOWO2_12_FULL_44_11 TaxID=1801796 RepID=A0A1F6Y7K6_9BACT|nr:MAG: methionine--tRNA ligase [Candidatus Nomurabacteria bacterium RIFCSPLOWO2_12_FULL_44_11]
MKSSFYITTTIPYVNADPHIGFALELVQSDVIARFKRLQGREVFFSTGTDEHGQKIWEASQKEGKKVEDYVNHYAQKFLELKNLLNLSSDNFIRTTSEGHIKAAQAFWQLCDQKGDIYKKKYKGLYCVGCEKFITEKDLMDGKCTLHPNLKPETVEEENYFFKLSNYKKQLLDYFSNPKTIIPDWRRQEAIDFVTNAMEDFSISRSQERFAWGISVPADESQVMYVWFDALTNYISTLGWPFDSAQGKPEENLFEKFWLEGEKVQTAGKDMVKFQSVMWQGMLMSAGFPTTDTIVYHGFITGEGGIKMSKSLGNVINPIEIVKEYGTDALRYFLLREISSFEDSSFTIERFKDAYNAGLANGLGNLVSRILTMAENNLEVPVQITDSELEKKFTEYIENYDLQKASEFIWMQIGLIDLEIQEKQPFKLIKTEPEKAKQMIKRLVQELYKITSHLEPLLPETAERIKKLIKENKKPAQPLFLRKD